MVGNLLNRVFIGAMLVTVCGIAFAQVVKPQEAEPQYAKIPVRVVEPGNSTVEVVAEVFMPNRPQPYPVVVYSHGRSSTPEERAGIKEVVPRDYLKFWLARGFAVVGPMRPGYGKTGGRDREIPGHSWDLLGNCLGKPNYRRVMDNASPTVLSTINWLQKQPWADTSSLILTGNSVGGVLTVAVGSQNIQGVRAIINFAGGIGGNPSRSPGKSCDPNQIRDLYASFGSNIKVPSLWLYAENDRFWGSQEPLAWYSAFAQGGSAARFAMTGPLPEQDGHDLVFLGKDLWQKPLDEFLRHLGF